MSENATGKLISEERIGEMSQELEAHKELSLEEAKHRISSALTKMKNNHIMEPLNNYEHIPFVPSLVFGIGLTVGGFITGIITHNPFVALLGFVVGIPIGLVGDWNGNPYNRIRNFLAKYVFTSKKKRLALKARQEEWERYYELEEIYQLYVRNTIAELENDGVLETINKHDLSQWVYFDENGAYCSSPRDNEEANESKGSDMMKELVTSHRIKEQLLGELNK